MDIVNPAWWTVPDEEQADRIFATVEHLDTDQGYRQKANSHFLRLYQNKDNIGQLLNTVYQTTGVPYDQRVTYNIVMSVIDTVVNKIAKQRLKDLLLYSVSEDYFALRAALRGRVTSRSSPT